MRDHELEEAERVLEEHRRQGLGAAALDAIAAIKEPDTEITGDHLAALEGAGRHDLIASALIAGRLAHLLNPTAEEN